MKKYFVAADIHGFYTLWMDELIKCGFDINNDNHILILLGDITDRGTESKEIIDFLYDFKRERRILIKGNHEDLFIEMVKRGFYIYRDIHNGTFQSYIDIFGSTSIMDFSEFQNTKYYSLYKEMLDYYETNKYIFTHAYIPVDKYLNYYVFKENWRNASENEWMDARWLNSMDVDDKISLGRDPKTIVSGHYHTSWGHCFIERVSPEFGDGALFSPFYGKSLIALDACTAYSKKVNVLVLKEDEL